jgi:hypothetical protein
MKNIINDQKHTGLAANSSSLPANQNSRWQDQLGRQDQLGLKIQKSFPSLTPCVSPGNVSGQQGIQVTLINTLLQQGVASHSLPPQRFQPFLYRCSSFQNPKIKIQKSLKTPSNLTLFNFLKLFSL